MNAIPHQPPALPGDRPGDERAPATQALMGSKPIPRQSRGLIAVIGAWMISTIPCPAAETIDFADLTLPAESFWNGPDPEGIDVDGQYGPERVGRFTSGEAAFSNIYDLMFNTWRGFAYANQTSESTTGPFNQFRAAGGAAGAGPGADNYAMAYGYLDLVPNNQQRFAFDPLNPQHLHQLPTLKLPAEGALQSVLVNNSAYTVNTLLVGDTFAKEFGGPSGDDPDWLKLTAYGTDEAGEPLGVAVDFYLADYRAEESAADYVVTYWTTWDLTPLTAARSVHFNLSSSDVGIYGMNTPAYFAIDNLTLSTTTPGDFNGDGAVDAIDYAVWREADGDSAAFTNWRNNYGRTATGAGAIQAPSPSSMACLACTILFGLLPRLRNR